MTTDPVLNYLDELKKVREAAIDPPYICDGLDGLYATKDKSKPFSFYGNCIRLGTMAIGILASCSASHNTRTICSRRSDSLQAFRMSSSDEQPIAIAAGDPCGCESGNAWEPEFLCGYHKAENKIADAIEKVQELVR